MFGSYWTGDGWAPQDDGKCGETERKQTDDDDGDDDETDGDDDDETDGDGDCTNSLLKKKKW